MLKFILILSILFLASNLKAEPATRPSLNSDTGDVVVLDQDGQKRAFFKELVGDREAVINFIYTHCEGICSTLGRRMISLQKALGPKSSVALVSISLDPEKDTPDALKRWSKELGAKVGWTLVTGKRQDLDRISTRIFGTGLISLDMHAPVLVLRDQKGEWIRLDGLTPVPELLQKLNLDPQAAR